MPAVITEQDKVRARHHLGYLNVQASSTYQLGIPAAVQTQFMIEGAFDKVLEAAFPKFISLLDELDCIECEFYSGKDTATIEEIGEIKINRKRIRELGMYYRTAQTSLANLMGIVPNPYDQRMWCQAAFGGVNAPVA